MKPGSVTFQSILLGLAMTGLLLALAIVPLAAAQGGRDSPLLVIAAPWSDIDAIVRQAGGRLVGPENAPLARLTVRDENPVAYDQALRAAGAWFVVPAAALARLCGVST